MMIRTRARGRLAGWAATVMFCLVTFLLTPVPAAAAKEDLDKDQDSFAKALTRGKADISLRYRTEVVEDDFAPVASEDAYASTLRTTLGYRTSRWVGFSAYVQFEDVSNLGAGDRHSTSPGNIIDGRPVIADPAGTELQQAYLRYTLDDIVDVSVGRVEFLFDDQRFVGPVAWRQNHQSFDVLKVDVINIPRTRLTYVYMDNVNRIDGGNAEMGSHLLNASIRIGSGKLKPYYYDLDYDASSGSTGLSTTTLGVAWENTWEVSDQWSIPYQAQYATQDDSGDNPNTVDADFWRLEVGAKHKACWFKVGYELLEGSPSEGQFNTPLATLHKFNGWADRFLTTPAGGLADLYVAVGGSWGEGWSAMGSWHDFSADNAFDAGGGAIVDSYGSELDAQILYKASWKQTFALKAAFYSADDVSALPISEDTTKIWFWTSYKF